MKKLFFDIQITGHHTEYINHIVDYLFTNNDLNEQYFFVVHPDFSTHFSGIVAKAKQLTNVNWIEITTEEFDKSQRGGLVKSSFSIFKLMDRYAVKFKIDHVFLLYFNSFQIPCILFRPKYSISGILFLQFYRMSRSTIKDKIKYYRKYYITKFYSLNPHLRRVFVLNDDKTAEFLNREYNTTIFSMLADPIPVLTPLKDFDIYEHYNIERSRKIFLHIGSLGDRKGTFEIIEAAKLIPLEAQKEIAILLVGKASDRESEIIQQKLEKAVKESEVTVLWDNQFVSSEMMKSLFDQCTAVLIPYKNAEASSGILGHAAVAQKCVLVPDSGLIGDIVKTHELGLLIDSISARDIAKGIERLWNCTSNKKLVDKFISEHSIENFSHTLLIQ